MAPPVADGSPQGRPDPLHRRRRQAHVRRASERRGHGPRASPDPLPPRQPPRRARRGPRRGDRQPRRGRRGRARGEARYVQAGPVSRRPGWMGAQDDPGRRHRFHVPRPTAGRPATRLLPQGGSRTPCAGITSHRASSSARPEPALRSVCRPAASAAPRCAGARCSARRTSGSRTVAAASPPGTRRCRPWEPARHRTRGPRGRTP